MTKTGPNRRELAQTFVVVWFVFSLYSLVSVPTPGVNEPHYLTKARSYQDPEFAAADFFLQSGDAHAVFFALTGPFTAVLPFATVAVLGRLLSLALLATGWVNLGRRFALSPMALFLSAVTFCGVAMTGNFSGEWVIGGFESKVPAYGLALLACARWVDASERLSGTGFVLCGVWTGLSIAIHPVVGMWFAIGICLAEVLLLPQHRRHPAWQRRWLLCGTVFCLATVLCSLPGLIPALQLTLLAGVETAVQDKANRIQVFGRLAHHLDAASFPLRGWIHAATLIVVTTLAAIVARRLHHRAKQPNKGPVACPSAMAQQRMACLLLVAVVIALVGAAVGWHSQPYPEIDQWEFKARWLRYYPFRFVDALLPVTCAFFVATVLDCLLTGSPDPTRGNRTARLSTRGNAILLVTGTLAVAIAAARIRPAAPSGYTAWKYWHWKAACRWIRDNTDREAVFLTPRESFGFKWFAERAEFVCVKDCPQDAAGIVAWNQRLWRQYRWSRDSYQNDARFDHADLERLQQQLGVTHVITRRLSPFADEPVYANEVWRIYAVDSPAVATDDPAGTPAVEADGASGEDVLPEAD